MMRFYNYIFAAGYEREIRIGQDFIPWCLPLGEILSIMGLNIFTLFFLFERWTFIEFTNTVSAFTIVFISIGLLVYYLRHKRHRRIWLQYHDQLKSKNGVELWLIYVCPLIISFFFMLLAGLYRNHDWIFGWWDFARNRLFQICNMLVVRIRAQSILSMVTGTVHPLPKRHIHSSIM